MPKKKKKGKKGKKKKGKKNESLEPPSEFDYLEPEILTQRIKEMEIDLNKLQIERNYMQLERVRHMPFALKLCASHCF